MPQTADNGDDPKSEAASGAAPKSAQGGRTPRSKSTIAIDLPAEAVREVNETAAPDVPIPEPALSNPAPGAEKGPEISTPPPSPAPSFPPAEATPRRGAAPVLFALAAGLAGGFAGGVLSDRLAPTQEAVSARIEALERRIAALPPLPAAADALAERIAGFEARLAEDPAALKALRADLARLDAALARESAERAAALETLARRSAPAGGSAGEHAALAGRVAALEAGGKVLPERIEALATTIASLESRLAARAAGEAIGRAQARLAAVTLVQEAFRTGRPLATPLDLLAKSGLASERLAALRPFAASGAPGARALLDDLRDARPKADARPAEGSTLDRLRASALSLVEIRKAGETTGSDDAAHLARAEQALLREDIAAALRAIGQLSPASAPAHAEWLKRATARQQAEAVLAALGGEALAALAAAAGGQ
ncbi:MAG: COG4223 family protein [Rhabdaerophilum calidifontis]